MKVLLFILCSVFLFVASEAQDYHSRGKRGHSGGFSKPNKAENETINEVINLWSQPTAEVIPAGMRISPRTLLSCRGARIDFQGPENHFGQSFSRYAIQIDGRTFSVIHIQQGIWMGVGVIRNAFEQSLNHQVHVFLSNTQQSRINCPDDGNRYSNRTLTRPCRKEPGGLRKIFIWSVLIVLQSMMHKFDKGGC